MLIERSKHDPGAFSELVERHGDGIRRYFGRRVDPDDVEDAVADLWETCFRRRHTFDPAVGTVPAWLYGIARYVTLHSRRRSVRRHQLVVRLEAGPVKEGDAFDPVEVVVGSEAVDRLRCAIADLPAHERDVVALVLGRQLSYDAAAELLDLPVGTVRSRLARARVRLQSRVGGE